MSRKNKKTNKITIKDNSLLIPILISLAFFLIVHMAAGDGIKGVSVFISIVALIFVAVKFKTFASRVRFPFVVMFMYFLLCGISTFYAVTGKFAMQEFYKMLIAFDFILIFMSVTPEGRENTGRWTSIFIEGYSFFLSVVSIDLISTRWISTPVTAFLSLFSGAYQNLKGVESGVRIISINGTPNVYAAIVSVGILITLGLIKNSLTKKERNVHIAALFVQTMGFVLSFSMGATAAFVAAFIVYMFIENKEKKISQVSLMIFVTVVCVAFAMIISQTSFTPWDGFDIVPLLLTIVGAAIVCVVDYFFGEKVSEFFNGKKKMTYIGLGSLAAFVLVFIILAVTITGPATISSSPALRRASYPKPGEYTMEYVSEQPVTVKIMSQNKEETIMHTETVLYSGPADNAKFTVPDDSLVVYFEIRAKETSKVSSVSYVSSDGKKTNLPLKYYLLPSFISNRIQGIWANENVIQRTVFWEDGMKLFARSPVFGRGLGGYQNGIIGAQSFFYETKYAHNHYVESLTDTGIVGFILFVSSLVLAFITIIRELRKKEEAHSLAPVLCVALIFMTLHAAFEVNFSYYSFIPVGWLAISMISTCCGDSFPLSMKDIWKKITAITCVVFVILFTVLMCMNISADNITKKEKTLTGLQKAIARDPFEWADHMASYVHSVTKVAVKEEVNKQALEYAERLSKLDSNAVPIILARFYFSRSMINEGFEMVHKYVMYSASHEIKWNESYTTISNYYKAVSSDEEMEQYEKGTVWVSNAMAEWNATNMGKISVSSDSKKTIKTMYLAYAERLLSRKDTEGFEILKQYIECLNKAADMTSITELMEKYKDNFDEGTYSSSSSMVQQTYTKYSG